MRQLKKGLLAMVCILAITGLTGCGRRGNQVTTESKTNTKMTETERSTSEKAAETQRDTERTTERNTTRDSEGVLEDLGEDVKNGVEEMGDDLLGTERGIEDTQEPVEGNGTENSTDIRK